MCTTRRCFGNLMTHERKSMLTQVFEKLRAWRNSPKLGQNGEVDEKDGWRNPVQLREQEVDALLAALQAAEDEEVDSLINKFRWGIEGIEAEATSRPLVDKLRDIAITRGQQLREAQELLDLSNEHGNLTLEFADHLQEEYKFQIATLTAELAALKSAPAMAEVDACIFTPEPYQYGVTTVYSETKYDGKKLADIARRSIASRDEVVGLLKRFQETSRKVVDVFGGTMNIEIDDATWRRGFEVWQELKGLLEIVEGNHA